jgi:hypothetical protein
MEGLTIMINIPVDEAVAFDMLSILEVKRNKCDHSKLPRISFEFSLFRDSLITQLGEGRYQKIVNSKEYDNLFGENHKLFEVIDMLRTGAYSITAKYIDDANLRRYQCKQALQKKFFGTEMNEVKFLKS